MDPINNEGEEEGGGGDTRVHCLTRMNERLKTFYNGIANQLSEFICKRPIGCSSSVLKERHDALQGQKVILE